MNADQEMPMPDATQANLPEAPITEGIYLVTNRYTRTHLDLYNAKTHEGAWVYMCLYIGATGFVEQHWLISPAQDNCFVFRNTGSDTVLEFEGNGEEGKHLECKKRRDGEQRQQWAITLEDGNYYSVRNASFSDKVLEVFMRGKSLDSCNDIDVVSRMYTQGCREQQWELERRSRTVPELVSLVGECPILGGTEIAWPAANVYGFIVIKNYGRDDLLKQSGLLREVSRPALADDKAFALKMKDTVRSWSAQIIRIEGYAVLFGVVCGSADVGSKAYNWYLTDDLSEIVFLDPSNGREHTAKGLQKKGFHAQWAIC